MNASGLPRTRNTTGETQMTMTIKTTVRVLSVAFAFGMATLSLPPAFARAGEKPAAPDSAYSLPETETFEVTAEDGYAYRIFVSKPAGEPPAGGYPVLYVLDGNAYFAAFAETRRNLAHTGSDLGKTIVVGVGYEQGPWSRRRLFDLTGSMPIPAPWDKELAGVPAGGWNVFLDFMTGDLRATMARRYRIDAERQALYGHSLGGLFAIHALFRKPEAFHAIVAASPSLFWHDTAMRLAERDFTQRLRSGKIGKVARLRVVTGELEETRLERTDAEAFAQRIAPLSLYGLRSEFELFEGETHVSVPVRSVASTMRFAFSWP